MNDYIKETYRHSEEYLKLLSQFCLDNNYFIFYQPTYKKIIISTKPESSSVMQLSVTDSDFFNKYKLWLGEEHEPAEIKDEDGEYYECPFSEQEYYLQELNLKSLPWDFQEKLAFFIWKNHSNKDFASFCSSELLDLRLDHVFHLTNNGVFSEQEEYDFIFYDRHLSLSSFLSQNRMDAQKFLRTSTLNERYSSLYDYVVDLLKNRSYEYKVKLLENYPKSHFTHSDVSLKDFLFELFDGSDKEYYFSQLYEQFPYLEKFIKPVPAKKEDTIEINIHLSQFSIEGLYYLTNPKGVNSYHIGEHFNLVQKYLNQDNLKNYLSQIGIEHFYVFKPKYDELNFVSHLSYNSKINIESWENLLINSIQYVETKEMHEKFDRTKEFSKSPLYQYLTTSLLEICLDNGQLKSSKKMKV